MARGDRDEYDLRQTAPAPFPPEGYVGYLAQPAIMRAIGVDPEVRPASHTPASRG